MDPLTVSAVVSVLNRVLGSAATQAGASAWAGLVKLVHSAFPERAGVAEAVKELMPGGGAGSAGGSGDGAGTAVDQNAVIDLGSELVGLARSDTGFERALREWLGRAESLSVSGGVTTNVISDGAIVHGNVVQAQDIGSISFGA
jgi:hypothetical protein